MLWATFLSQNVFLLSLTVEAQLNEALEIGVF